MSEILVGTRGGLRSADGEPGALSEPIVALAAAGDAQWALVGDSILVRSDADGWERVDSVHGYRARCLLPIDQGLLVGTSEAHLFRLSRDALELAEEFEAAPGRDRWYTPWGGPPDTRSMSADPAGTVYVNVHVGGILRTRGQGAWEPTIDIDADVHQVLAHPSEPGTVLAACAGGLATSSDGGDTWEVSDHGLHGSYSRAVAVADETILLTASTGPFTDQAAVYRRPVGGDRFERCTGGLPEWFPSNIDTHCLAAGGSVVAFGTDGGEVWRSEDQGRTWERSAAGLPAVTCLLIA